MEPQIISSYDGGKHNINLEETVSRLEKEAAYKNLSTVIIIPTERSIPPRVVSSWLNMMNPPNQRIVRLFATGMEVGDAYSRTIESVLAHPELRNYKFVLTLEADNAPPSDGFIRLLADMEANPNLAAIGGLYFTKGYGGVAQIWGDPNDHPLNFRPQKPNLDGSLKKCNGTGMGFTMFRLDMFKDPKLRKPWFKTAASREEGCFTQDLWFWQNAFEHGYKCAVDCSIKVGHYDHTTDTMW